MIMTLCHCSKSQKRDYDVIQTSIFEYKRVEEDWRKDAVKLSWRQEDIKDDRYSAIR